MKKAIFLDRDGVINELVMNPETGDYEPPHRSEQVVLFPWAIESLILLQNSGFELFVISNQPDYAKGKTSIEALQEVHARIEYSLSTAGINIREYYYCYHHPQGIVPRYSGECPCRKPKPYFILKAAEDYGILVQNSWMVGDRDTDIDCGKAAGTKTALIMEPHSSRYRGSSNPDFIVANLKEASKIILKKNN
jgi:D-glycero-D-manno-heptose 1,7-bisphosphate phosphatase